MRIRIGYALATLAILLIEIFIALFVRDAIVRPYVGDVLAVVLVYLGLRSVTRLAKVPAVAAALAIAFAIEIGQFFHVVDLVGLRSSRVARIVLGTSFAWEDFAAYALGGLLVFAVERWRMRTP